MGCILNTNCLAEPIFSKLAQAQSIVWFAFQQSLLFLFSCFKQLFGITQKSKLKWRLKQKKQLIDSWLQGLLFSCIFSVVDRQLASEILLNQIFLFFLIFFACHVRWFKRNGSVEIEADLKHSQKILVRSFDLVFN